MPSDPTAKSTRLGDTVGSPSDDVLDKTSRAVTASYGQAQAAGDQVATFIRGQPIAAALIALGLGYILGRLRI